MSSENTPGRRSPDAKGGSNFGFFMGIILFGLAAAFLAVYLINVQTIEVRYTDLLTLIEQQEVVIHRDEEKNIETFLTNLKDVEVGAFTVTGNVTRHERFLTQDDQQPSHGTAGRSNNIATEKLSSDPSANQNNRKEKLRYIPFRTNKLNDENSTALLRAKLETAARPIPYSEEGGPTFWKSYGPAVLITIVFLAAIYLMLRRLGGAGSPMTFGRSKGRLYAQEDLGVSFDDVAGIEEAVEEVKEVVDFLKSPEKYQRLGGRIPRGVLLVGPPGTGKTLLAKAIAGEAGVPFFSLSGSDFVEMFVGVGAARVRDMFQQAEVKAPCIVFIDELDALGKSRGTSMIGGHDEREQTLNALLVEMDGFESNIGIIVMAATNRPEMLDQALMRPGRFDRQVLVDRPDIRGREDILKVHVKNVKLDPTVNLKDVAGITPGFVGADLANLVNEAALLAARKNKDAVGMQEFNEGVERVTAGLEKKQRVMNDDEKVRVAYHEGGHALVAYSLPNTDPVHKVSIIPRGFAALGYTLQRPDGDRYLMTQAELESRIQVLLAGTIAEEMIFDDISTGASNDLERSTEIARSMVMDYGMSRLGRVTFRDNQGPVFLAGSGEERLHSHSEETAREIDREVKRIVDESLEKVREILHTRRAALVAMAERLMEVESIEAQELQEIIEKHSPGPRVVPGTVVKRAPSASSPAEPQTEGDSRPAEGGA